MIPPYATMVDPPVYEKRADALLPPWLKDEPEIVTGRSHDPDAFMPCNSQTAPFATFHNLPSPLEYDGPLTEAPWNKETPVNPTYRGPYPNEYRHSSPFAITDNYKQPPQQLRDRDDAPWDKKLPDQIPVRGSGVHEHSNLPSSQTAPFATTENFEHQKQYDGPMPDAPWNKDQRPASQQKAPNEDYSKNVPYATAENMGHQEKSTREIEVAPWNKFQSPVNSGKGNEYHGPTGSANSHTAPYATLDNRTIPKPNRAAGFQAPWDRDEVHYKRFPPRFVSGDEGFFSAPYATEPR